MILDPVRTLEELIAIPSVNPMGGSATGSPYGEAQLTAYLENVLVRLGLSVERQTVAPGRENIIARFEGDAGQSHDGPVILLDAHQDTVPVEGMTIEPFSPQRRDGRLYGRGACDTKGGMAAMLAAVSRLVTERPCHRPTIIVSCTVNEEHGFTGAARLMQTWADGRGGVLPCKPDAVVVLEPTGLDVVIAHKGMIRWRCRTLGRAAHSSCPEAGDNAIYRMAKVLAVLEHYSQEVLPRASSDRRCGLPTLSVGTIHGGAGVNVVPNLCTVEIDLRMPPGEGPEAARRKVIDDLAQSVGPHFPLEHDPPMVQGQPLTDQCNLALADQLVATVQDVVGSCRRISVPYATNAGHFSAAGIPTVVFGPGFIEQAHTADEWIPLDQLHRAADVLYQFCRQYKSDWEYDKGA